MTGLEEVIREQIKSVLSESLRDWFGKSKSKEKAVSLAGYRLNTMVSLALVNRTKNDS